MTSKPDQALASRLLARIEQPGADLDARLVAGAELAKAGDPRVRPARVAILAGPFLFRGSQPEGGAPEPPRDAYLSAFEIDRYPVTVGAYAEFVDAGGYREARFWSRAGARWRRAGAIERPRFWGEAEWAAYLVPNHPVVGVSFYEAEAYAAFRDARLPSEAEWEKAARGLDGRRHPWGDAWIDDACAHRGYGPRGTVPIGSFPKGASPFGLHDVVGCVWQWCRDVLDEDAELDEEDPFVDPDGYADDAERVTKGGGWNNLPWSVCCTSRNGYPPTARFSNLGFRCARDAAPR